MIQEKSQDVKTDILYCANCGRIIDENEDAYKITEDGKYICNDCKTTYGYINCDNCNLWFLPEHIIHTADGYFYCSDCLEELDYTQCDECGEWYQWEDMRVVDSDSRYERFICIDCCENDDDIHQCQHCDEWFSNNGYTDDYGNSVCSDCYCRYDYYRCTNCERLITLDECISTDNGWYCSTECREEYEGPCVIHSYHDAPPLKFYKNSTDVLINEHYRYFGIELEVDDGNTDCASDVLNTLGGENFAHLEHDGSLSCDGFEIVTQAMTVNYMKPWLIDKFSDAIKILRENHYLSHYTETCGLHIHVSRNTLTAETIDKMVITADKFEKIFKKLSRRKDFTHYARTFSRLYDENDTEETRIKKLKDYKEYTRYLMINTTNRHTIELRLFKGTLNLSSILAALEFYTALIEWAETHTESEILSASDNDFIHALYSATDGHHLSAYLVKRGIK